MSTRADERIRQAATRLANAPVQVPDFGRVARGRRRTRLFATGAMLACITAGAVSALPDNGAVRIHMRVADEGPEQTEPPPPDGRDRVGTPVLDGDQGIWPGGDRRFGSAEEMAKAFTSEVLGWDTARVSVQPPEPVNHPVGVTFSRPDGGEVRATAAPIRGRWVFTMIGSGGLRVGYGDDLPTSGSDVRVTAPPGPTGTTASRMWARLDGEQTVEVNADRGGRFLLRAQPDAVKIVMVIHVDRNGSAVDVVAAMF